MAKYPVEDAFAEGTEVSGRESGVVVAAVDNAECFDLHRSSESDAGGDPKIARGVGQQADDGEDNEFQRDYGHVWIAKTRTEPGQQDGARDADAEEKTKNGRKVAEG